MFYFFVKKFYFKKLTQKKKNLIFDFVQILLMIFYAKIIAQILKA